MEDVGKKAKQQTDEAVLDIELHAYAGGEIADQRFIDSIHAKWIVEDRILCESGQGADEEAANLSPPHDGEVDHHQQRHLQKPEELKKQWDVNLEGDRGQ